MIPCGITVAFLYGCFFTAPFFVHNESVLKQCESTVVSWGAERPGDVRLAPTEAERRPNPSILKK